MGPTITRILVPTDFSVHSEAAVRYATDLADHLGATVSLLHVLDDPFVSGAWPVEAFAADAAGFLQELADDGRKRLAALVAALRERGIAADAEVITGSPSTAIVEQALQGHYDLIVMGTHGRTGLSHAVIGSVAERVQRKARCPVLTVKADARPARERRAPAPV
jgi:nucleotide-binding universal stress UspA family protein